MPSGPLAPFSLRAPHWLARPPPRFPPARPALAPSARLRCRVNWNQSRRPQDSHNAQRAARHIPSRPRASGHPARAAPALTPAPPPRARRLSSLGTEGLASGPLPSGTARRGWTPGAGPPSRDALAEALLQRTSQPVRRPWHLLSAYCAPGPQHGTFAASSLESFAFTQRRRRNGCSHFSLPAPLRAPSSPPLPLDKSPPNVLSFDQLSCFITTPRSLDLLCTREPLATSSLERTFTVEPSWDSLM